MNEFNNVNVSANEHIGKTTSTGKYYENRRRLTECLNRARKNLQIWVGSEKIKQQEILSRKLIFIADAKNDKNADQY